MAATGSASVCVVSGGAVLNAGLACVGGAVIEDLCTVAASGRGKGECWHGGFSLCYKLRLGLQTPASLAKMLWSILGSANGKHINPINK